MLEAPIGANAERWESAARKLNARQMPPPDEPRPAEADYDRVVESLEEYLDQRFLDNPNPGRTETFRHLTRVEYRNAVRDLLAIDIDVDELLPRDEASHGFDNITVANLSPALLERYIGAARKISRLAVGVHADAGAEKTYRVRPDITQDAHLAGTPIGTRGGAMVRHYFPQDGEYEIQARLMRDRNEELEGRPGDYGLEVAVDRERVALFPVVRPPLGAKDKHVDADLRARLHVSAGAREVSVAFLRRSASLQETVRQPLHVHYNFYRHPRIEPAVYEVTIRGPFGGRAAHDTPSRRRVFTCYPTQPEDESRCAELVLSNVMRRAYRREVSAVDLQAAMKFYHAAAQEEGFDAGVQSALSAILVSPHFLFHIERDPESAEPGAVYPISCYELASRLSFLLWSSIPDEELLGCAANDQLRQPEVLASQVARMLADNRSRSLSTNFAAQWLHLRNLDAVVPDM
ncbi:MAG: DUF1592 domain-containing protein, partial [Planctomycetales bacterium]|nr:DUF1592 domain-containing protein [Planctomycetales bacterium]